MSPTVFGSGFVVDCGRPRRRGYTAGFTQRPGSRGRLPKRRPSSPKLRQRLTHFDAVALEMPILAATCAIGRVRKRSNESAPPSKVRGALRCVMQSAACLRPSGLRTSLTSRIVTAPRRLPVMRRCHLVQDGRAARNPAIVLAASTISALAITRKPQVGRWRAAVVFDGFDDPGQAAAFEPTAT